MLPIVSTMQLCLGAPSEHSRIDVREREHSEVQGGCDLSPGQLDQQVDEGIGQ